MDRLHTCPQQFLFQEGSQVLTPQSPEVGEQLETEEVCIEEQKIVEEIGIPADHQVI